MKRFLTACLLVACAVFYVAIEHFVLTNVTREPAQVPIVRTRIGAGVAAYGMLMLWFVWRERKSA